MGVYTEDLLAVRTMLQQFGATTTLKRKQAPGYDPINGPQLGPEPLEATVHTVVFPISRRGERFQDRTLTRSKARQFYLLFTADVDTVWRVKPGDLLYFEERWWPILDVDPLNPDDMVPLLYSGVIELP